MSVLNGEANLRKGHSAQRASARSILSAVSRRIHLARCCLRFFPGRTQKMRLVACALLYGRPLEVLRRKGIFGGRRMGTLVAAAEEFAPFRLRIDMSRYSRWQEILELLVDRLYDLSSVPFSPRAVLDAGAFMGVFSLMAAARWPTAEIMTIEPSEDAVRHLEDAKRINKLTRWQIVHGAVAARSGIGAFAESEGMSGHLVSAAQSGIDTKVVRLISLQEALRGGAFSEDLVLKMDIEGGETAVLPDLVPALPTRCVVFIETHHGEESRRANQELFLRHGFLVKETRVRDPYADWVATRCGGSKRDGWEGPRA